MKEFIKEIKEEYEKNYNYFKNSKDIKFDMKKINEIIINKIAKDYALSYSQVKKMIEEGGC